MPFLRVGHLGEHHVGSLSNHLLGQFGQPFGRRRIDSIPFSAYHLQLILVLGAVGFVEGYDQRSAARCWRWPRAAASDPRADSLARGRADPPRRGRCLHGLCDFRSGQSQDRDAIGVVVSTFFTLLIPLAQSGTQLIIIRVLTGIELGFCVIGAVPDRRRTDAGPAPPHLRRDLRGHAGERLHAAALCRLRSRRQSGRFPPDRAAGRSRARCRAVAGTFRLPESPRWYWAWVPLDDGHTMFFFLWWKRGVSAMTPSQPVFKDGRPIGGTERGNKFLPNTTDWFGRFRLAANPSNDWQIDRTAQEEKSIYSGIEGVHLQDQAITESMGPITDHGFEHLAPSDQMITRTRRRLLIAARALRDQGILPPGVENADVFRGARSGYFVSDDKSPWQEIYATQLAASAPRPRRRRTSGIRGVA